MKNESFSPEEENGGGDPDSRDPKVIKTLSI